MEAGSWKLVEDLDSMTLVALYIRDAWRLDTRAHSDLPPRLRGVLPDHSEQVPADQRSRAATDWVAWWRAIVATRIADRDVEEEDTRARLPRITAERAEVFDPPGFDTLGDRPALQRVARAAFNEASQWANAVRGELLLAPHGQPSQFDQRLPREIIANLVRQQHIEPSRLHAEVLLLPVDGVWWRRVAPGVVLCSLDAARNEAIARDVLVDAFTSCLAR